LAKKTGLNILFISHRVPYPPIKGEKIRSYRLLRHMARRHKVYLATHVDSSDNESSLIALRPEVERMVSGRIRSKWKKIVGLAGLVYRKPISVSYFYSRTVQAWVDQVLNEIPIDVVFCSSSPTAEYIFRSRHYANEGLSDRRLLMDLIDVDSYKWSQYGMTSRGLLRWIYRIEGRHLKEYEKRIATEFHNLFLVSKPENKIFQENVAEADITVLSNGVDLDYFRPAAERIYTETEPVLTFTGVMDYRPNVEGVAWFANMIFPKIQVSVPQTRFLVVGSRPLNSIRSLTKKNAAIKVTGFVEDIRPYMTAADVCIVPLRIARGVQNKVLEAMAMGKAIVCTPQALEGIEAVPERDVLTAEDEKSFSEAVLRLFKNKDLRERLGRQARQFVEKNHSWDSNLAILDSILTSFSRSGAGAA
jgi:sugar transferase (PEP-CTERM/EpsH1 system associated)